MGQCRLVRIPTPRAVFWWFELADPHPSGHFLPPVTLFWQFLRRKHASNWQIPRDKNVFRSTIHPGPTKIVDFGGLNAMQRHVTPFSVDFGRGYGEGLAPPTPGAPGVTGVNKPVSAVHSLYGFRKKETGHGLSGLYVVHKTVMC